MRIINIKYTDFWRKFDAENFIFTRLLSKHYDVRIAKYKSDPVDLLIYSCFGNEHLKYNSSLKLFFTGENILPNFNDCDYAIGFSYMNFDERYLRYPLFLLYPIKEVGKTYYERIIEEDFYQKTDNRLNDRNFCSLVVSNRSGRDPIFFEIEEKLSQYKEIAYGGKYKNNTGGRIKDKLSFIANYKFNIASENSAVEGYTTEKIIEPLFARTIPIYWGNPLINKDFDPRTFINMNDFESIDQGIEYIKKVDNDPELYLSYFKHRPIINEEDTTKKLESFLFHIADKRKKYRQDYGNQMKYDKERRIETALYKNRVIHPFYFFLK
ncbi:glycosyltransferase family 10 [Bacteroidales bacterium OttesenSCG-928-A17]|nr:glycosyltransferase family 10 [Bacteroidales bacterium OttesenSCG-928-A17]